MFDFRDLVAALYDNGSVWGENDYFSNERINYIELHNSPSASIFVTVILEDNKLYLLHELISLGESNVPSLLILQQQCNMILEVGGHVGKVCIDMYGEDTESNITLMYSMALPCSLDVDAAAQLVSAAGDALAMLAEAIEELEPKVVDGCLDAKDAFLVAVGQEEEPVEITIHPVVQLLKLTTKQRDIFLSFLSNNGITLDAFLQTKRLDVFPVITDECEICMSNGSGCCWQIAKLPIAKNIRRVELEEMLSGPYELYRAAAIFLGISQYKSLFDLMSELSLSLY